MKLSNIMERDFKLVEKKKIWYLIPACIVAVAIIVMIIVGCVTGEPLNLGMDFQGGYTINVNLSTKLTDATYESYRDEIISTIENLKDENGNSYNLKPSARRQGSGSDASVYVMYKAVADEATMEDVINPAIQEALQAVISKSLPEIKPNETNTEYALTYSEPLVWSTYLQKTADIRSLAAKNGVTVSKDFALDESGKVITFGLSAANEQFASELSDTASINDKYFGQAQKGDTISATVSGELLVNALLAICLSVVLMLVYIAFRFEVSSGIAAVVALLHDIVIMFSFMAIFHIEINSTFIAALITILGYSINNTIIVFDRIRENVKSLYYKNSSATVIANASIKETLVRSINTSITTLITITMVAIIGVPSIRIFALPIIAGLLAGTFSSMFIAPSIWALWKDRKRKAPKAAKENKAAIA